MAAAAVAFSTLYSPASENSNSLQGSPLRNTRQRVSDGVYSTSAIRQVEFSPKP